MPSYLILRIVSFFIAFCVPILFVNPMLFGTVAVPLTIAHYFLAIPYSKKHIVNVMKRRSTSAYFMGLIAASLILASAKNPNLLFFMFGIHYVFTEVYLLYDNVIPNRWRDTRALRIASLVCNMFAYLAAIRTPWFQHSASLDTFIWTGYAVSACVFAYQLLRMKNSLTRGQIIQAFVFEALGLALVILGHFHPIYVFSFIYYHIIFWILYPSWKMIEFRQFRPLSIFLTSNIVVCGLFMLISPFSRQPIHLNWSQWGMLFNGGALVHIIMSFGITTAQPGWITRIFHPGFTRKDDSAASSALVAAPVVREKVLQN
jgi:hypothetical protein